MLSLLLVTLAIASLATNLDMKTNFVNYTIPETEKIIGLSGVTSIQGETDDIRNKSIERDKAEGNSPFPECRGQQLCDNLLNISTSTLTPNVANMSEKVIIETQIPATFRKFNISERTGIGDNLITSSDNLVKENSKKFKLNARKVGERSTKKTPQTNQHKSFQSDDIFRRKIRGEGNMNSVSTMIVLGKNQRQSRTTKVLSQNQSITTEGSTVETMKVSTTTTHKYTSPLRSDYPFESIVLSGKNPSDSSDFSGSSLRPTWDTTPPKPVAVSNSVGKTRNFIKVSTITSHSTESVTPATKKEAKTFGVVKYANKFSQSPFANLKIHMETPTHRSLLNLLTTEGNLVDLETGTKSVTDDLTTSSGNFSDGVSKVIQQQEIPWPVKKEAVVEGDLVLGGLMMVHEREDTITCGPVMPQGGIQALEAMLYTLDRLNFGSESILPNITLGAHILDDCDKDTYGLEMAVDFIKGSISNIDGAEYHCNKTQVRKVISGVVGAASSVTSIQVANLLRLFKIPQVSFFSTSPELSNKQRFEFFTRTIPSDHYQVKAMVNIVILMGWSYISIIYEESNYGIKPLMIIQNGYEVFTYYVTTPDGYVLEIFRIPPKEDDNRKNKQPIILEHGIFVDSGSWIFTGNGSLAITLASMGYDVWLSNQRGTRYSRTHNTLNAAGYDYWLYSIDQVASNDVPTILEKVALETGKSGSIIYIGHSRGSTLIFMYASTFPQKTEKLLKGIIALSPVVYLDLDWYLKPLGKLGPLIGEDLLAYFSHYPASIAVMQLIQYTQIYISDKFQKYDYGLKNLEIYKQVNPPVYHLCNITTPVFMFYGKHDIVIKTQAFEELEDLLAEHNICIAVKEKLVKDSGVADESAYDNIVQKLLTKPRARGCIIFGSDQEVAGVMRAVRRSNATGSFSWIGSDGWSARSLVSDGNEAEVEGTLSVQPQANPVRGFEEYFLSLNVENNSRNPWFIEFWEHHFQCRYPNSSKTPYNQKHSHLCTGKEKLTRQNTVFEDQLQFVSDAVMAFAYAIRDMHRDLCHGRPGLCDAMKPTKGTELLKYLRKVDFEGLSGDRFHFDSNGDGPARYNIIHFKQVSKGKYQWVRVGEYVEGELRLNMSEIQFKLGHPKPPESVCSFPCDLGQAKKYVEGESCCWHCFNCTQYQILHPKDPTQCIACPQGTVPDPHHIRCEDIPEEYLRPDSGWAIGAMAFSSTGILITMFVCGVFIRHNDTPVVRASGRELSYVLLAGILMCFSVTYALVLRPNDVVCGIQRFGAGFCFTVVYAALLTKTNRISRIFNAGKHSAKRPSFISPRSQLIICSGLVGVQVLINGVWMVISPARAIHHYPTREDNLLVCSSYIDASYMIAFTYPIFLIVICTVYAVLTRKIPEAFNESKHIGFTMYTTCVIWLAFVPLYFGTANHVALRITSMSVTISLSASVTVACLFSPKLYIILIRPERNVRQSMMPMRYSAINKSSATTGSGSMMAAVMVTAATCDQKQQIQKHVPPVEKDEDLSESKVKPETKDISTQTSPAISNNMLNSSQEHLPKINNNCNVGNGPIGILPCVQTKDFPL